MEVNGTWKNMKRETAPNVANKWASLQGWNKTIASSSTEDVVIEEPKDKER